MANNLYLALPSWAQNLALSFYGANLYRQRFHGSMPTPYNNDLKLFELPQSQVFEQQETRLQELLSHCKAYVPYYEKYLKDVDPTRISVADLPNLIPVLTKTEILGNADKLVSTAPHLYKKLRNANTSGSSGTPLSIKYTDDARRINYRFYEAALNYFGCNYRSRSTTFAGRILYKDPGSDPARYDHYNRTQYLSSYFVSPSTIESYVKALNDWQPEFIDSYPSSIFEIIKLAESQQLKFTFSPKCVLTSSETLTNECRAAIEKAFNTTVIDHYGCTEMAINALSVGEHYFASPLYSVIELEHQFDETYSVITTGLLNFGMPLLRYKIGDLVEKSTPSSNYLFSRIEGRLDDVIITPEGRKVGRMDPAFKGIEGITCSQIIQESINSISVVVVLSESNGAKFNSTTLIDNIKARTSQNIDVNIIYASEIQKGANGKLKSVISKVKK